VIRVPTGREPTHPGDMLRDEFLDPMDLIQQGLADAIHVPFQRVNEIVRGRLSVTPSTALRLDRYFGTSAEFWMDFQGRKIHIRYFPLFEENGASRSVIEVSQDITEIQNLSGERRLLDWE